MTRRVFCILLHRSQRRNASRDTRKLRCRSRRPGRIDIVSLRGASLPFTRISVSVCENHLIPAISRAKALCILPLLLIILNKILNSLFRLSFIYKKELGKLFRQRRYRVEVKKKCFIFIFSSFFSSSCIKIGDFFLMKKISRRC